MIPLLLAGLSVAIALKAGLFTIGAEGQLLVGACVAAWIGFRFQLPAPWHWLLSLSAGAVAGALWALLPALLRVWRGAHEVITTIMFNYIAFYFTHWLVTEIWKDPTTGAPQTPTIHATASLGALGPFQATSWGLPMAVTLAVIVWIVMYRTVWGYELRAVGANRDAAEAAGVPVKRRMVVAFVLAGAFAGLAGAMEVCGYYRNFFEGFSSGYGFDSIAVSLLAGNHPGWVIGAAGLFSALQNGTFNLHVETGAPKEIAIIVQGLLILYVASLRFRRGRLES
jgi:simple sugar transport system permease protein